MQLGNISPIYPLWAFMMVALSIILIPRKEYKYLLPHGILGILSIGIMLAVAINIIKAWKYAEIGSLSLLGIPLFILGAWGATIIIFLWAIPYNLPNWVNYLYIALFAIISVILDITFHNLGLRPFASWYRSWMWFFVTYGVFWINYKVYMMRLNYEKENVHKSI